MKTISYKHLIICIITASCFACNKQEYSVDLPVYQATFTNQIKLSDYFSSLNYVFLEDHQDGQFIDADKIIYHQQNWYIFDKELMAILSFNQDGEFRFRIQTVGKGPGEYQLLSSIFLVPEKNELWAHCRMTSKHLVYSLEGTFLREEKCYRSAYDMEYLGKDKILMFNIDPYIRSNESMPAGLFFSASEISKSDQVLETVSSSMYHTNEARRNFSLFQDTVFFLSQSDSLVAINSKGEFMISGIFNFGDLHPSALLKSIPFSPSNAEKLVNSGKVFWKDQPVCTSRLFFFQFGLNQSVWYGIIDRNRHSLLCTQGFVNDLNYLPYIFPSASKSETELVGLLTADLIYAYQESLSMISEDQKHNEKYKLLNEFIDQALQGSGHVLVITKTKS
ncbi:MAG: 6-bladed beta-propeller [Bacteroidetes bacterium]|jgi:hypothetical protein|nr:6-bladed beta-propeller [Bacteroidota bacterium]MBT3751520.1 6-bladed beta-propeller [Bacteroidota bacterium]MBT4398061.1 6-bladed beta-propeller [Bacteroidota bacterium]MBT4409937.1 6-bladed beta-propeller [Bacteroidota bacterium]MBT5424718.1 6-bladed beta-propeller [Bacteroidota bacterium]